MVAASTVLCGAATIMAAGILAARAGCLPTAKGLEAGPCARCRALRTVGVADTGLDVIEEPGCFLFRAIESCRQTVINLVGVFHRLVQVLDLGDGRNRQEHLVLP